MPRARASVAILFPVRIGQCLSLFTPYFQHLPTFPFPTIPTTSSWHVNGLSPSLSSIRAIGLCPGLHSPALVSICTSNILRRVAKYSPRACSDTDSIFALGQLLTTIPRFLQASKSTQSVPVATIAMNLRCGDTSGDNVTASSLMFANVMIVASRIRSWRSDSAVRG